MATAGDSVVPVRYVLGTVPVEADGSAHFVVPANREIFFQAVDAKGLAMQSMRSATYLHEGERLVCAGCHEPKHRSPQPVGSGPLALRREPSRLKPDVDGSNPFSYPRLVQPVLDRHCVQCHAQNAGKTMSLASRPLTGRWYASYANLVQQYGFHDYGDGYRTTPGRFGARASKLYQVLNKGPLRCKTLRRGHAPADALAGLLVVVLRRLREGGRRGPAPWRDRPADVGIDLCNYRMSTPPDTSTVAPVM